MPGSRSVRSVAALLPLLLVTAGCSGDGEADSRPGATGCVTIADATAFEPIGTLGESRPTKVGPIAACEVLLTESPIGAATLQVIDLPAAEWATGVGPAIDQVRAAITDPEMLAQLDEGMRILAEGNADSDAGACQIFTAMVTAHGMPPGSNAVVNYVPDEDAPLAINAQVCVDGRYLSVQVAYDRERGPLQPTESTTDDLLRIADLLRGN